jgi:hypothetical protein
MGNENSSSGSSGGGYSAQGLGFNRRGGDDPFTPSFTPSYTPPPKTESSYSYISKMADIAKDVPLIGNGVRSGVAETQFFSNALDCGREVITCVKNDTSNNSTIQTLNDCINKNESTCHLNELHDANRDLVVSKFTR